jgi:hypothetical protein
LTGGLIGVQILVVLLKFNNFALVHVVLLVAAIGTALVLPEN